MALLYKAQGKYAEAIFRNVVSALLLIIAGVGFVRLKNTQSQFTSALDIFISLPTP